MVREVNIEKQDRHIFRFSEERNHVRSGKRKLWRGRSLRSCALRNAKAGGGNSIVSESN